VVLTNLGQKWTNEFLLLNLFVVVVMFSIGLRVSGGELLDILRKRALFVRCGTQNSIRLQSHRDAGTYLFDFAALNNPRSQPRLAENISQPD